SGWDRPRVYRAAGDVAVMRGAARQQRRRLAHYPWGPAPGVDHGVPGVIAKRGPQLRRVRPVRPPHLRARDVLARFAAVERRDLVAAGERGLHDGPSDMMGAAKHEKSHQAILLDEGRSARTCSFTA